MAVDRAQGWPLFRPRRRRRSLRVDLRRLVAAETLPLVALVAGVLLVALAASLVAVRIEAIALDETLLKQSAVHYGSGLPGSLFHDLTARGTSRLYSLVLTPLFVLFDGDVAVRAARVLNTLLFASTALPAYLLARTARLERWPAAAAGLLSIALPWLILTTAIYTENLAYPLFIWAVWAAERAVRAPAPRRDAAALVLIGLTMCTRTQFGILFVAYGLCILLAPLVAARARGEAVGDVLPVLGRRLLRGHPFAVAAVGAGVVAMLYFSAHSGLHHEVQVVFGSYSEIQDRTAISSDMSLGLLVEVVALSLGVGLLPAILAIAWYSRALGRGGGGEAAVFALVAVVFVVVFAGATIYAQGGYLGPRAEERYYFYAVPFVWIGALAALQRGRAPSARALCVAGGALSLLFATIPIERPLDPESGFLAPVLASLHRLLPEAIGRLGIAGLTPRDLLFVLGVVAAVALAATLRRGPRARWALVVLPVAVQLGLTAYAFAVARGDVSGVPPRTGSSFAADGWIDRALAGGEQATWLNNQPRPDPAAAELVQRAALFFNDRLTRVVDVAALAMPPVATPLDALAISDAPVDRRDGALRLPGGPGPVIQVATSPQLQLAGRRRASSAVGDLELVDAGARPRLRWLALGLTSEGWIDDATRVRVLAGDGPAGRPVVLALSLVASPNAAGRVVVRAGGRERTVALRAQAAPQPVTVHLVACAPAGRPLTGELRGSGGAPTPDGRRLAARVAAVRVSPASGRC